MKKIFKSCVCILLVVFVGIPATGIVLWKIKDRIERKKTIAKRMEFFQKDVEVLKKYELGKHSSMFAFNDLSRAIEEVGWTKNPSAVPYLVTILKDKEVSPGNRRGVINALVEIRDKSAVPVLEEALNDEDISIRHKAGEALDKFSFFGRRFQNYPALSFLGFGYRKLPEHILQEEKVLSGTFFINGKTFFCGLHKQLLMAPWLRDSDINFLVSVITGKSSLSEKILSVSVLLCSSNYDQGEIQRDMNSIIIVENILKTLNDGLVSQDYFLRLASVRNAGKLVADGHIWWDEDKLEMAKKGQMRNALLKVLKENSLKEKNKFIQLEYKKIAKDTNNFKSYK